MTPEKYAEWTTHHADLFRLCEPSDARLLTLWATSLMPFEFDELKTASLAVAEDPGDKKRWRENHLAMLREHVLGKRADATARERDRLDRLHANADCDLCFGVGLVRVPHVDWIVDGDLERPFFVVVACTCQVGARRFNAINGELTKAEGQHRLMDLQTYEGLVPDWRNIMAARRERQAAEFEGAELARKVDRIAPINAETINVAMNGRASR